MSSSGEAGTPSNTAGNKARSDSNRVGEKKMKAKAGAGAFICDRCAID